MLILPERGIARGKALIPQKPEEWRTPSALSYDHRMRWRIDAKLHDGHQVWRGWFDDREDFDAFVWAIAEDTLEHQRELWRLCSPWWHPDLGYGADLGYYIFTTVPLATTSGANQTWNVPSDYNSSSNSIESVGGGGTGSAAGATNFAAGGGAGAYAKTLNLTLTPGGTATFFINLVAAGVSTSGTGVNGNTGSDVWLSNTGAAPTLTSQGVLAKGGKGGTVGVPPTGGAGGEQAGNTGSVGNTIHKGGSSGGGDGGSGGGGAAGPSGDGGTSTAASANATAGGSADNGTTAGTAGVSSGTSGNSSAGTEFDGSHGCGAGTGGSGTGGIGAACTSGIAANYGGASGAASSAGNQTGTSGQAGQGLLFITYSPQGIVLFRRQKIIFRR